jgi:hypothetical protein
MLIVNECPASLGVMDALAQEVGCPSVALVQAVAALPPSARFYRPFCATRPGEHTDT